MDKVKTFETQFFLVDVLWELTGPLPLEGDLETIVWGLDHGPPLVWQGGQWDNRPLSLEFALHLVGDEKMWQLNERYRSRPTTTDVLSFPLYEDLRECPPDQLSPANLGDIIISLEQAERQAREHEIPLPHEVAHLFVHGLLHLLGFDHKVERERAVMFALEEQLVKEIYRKCAWE